MLIRMKKDKNFSNQFINWPICHLNRNHKFPIIVFEFCIASAFLLCFEFDMALPLACFWPPLSEKKNRIEHFSRSPLLRAPYRLSQSSAQARYFFQTLPTFFIFYFFICWRCCINKQQEIEKFLNQTSSRKVPPKALGSECTLKSFASLLLQCFI